MPRTKPTNGSIKALPRQLGGYALASVIALVADAGLLQLLTHHAHWPYLPASMLSFTTGAFVAYALSIKLAFRHHRLSHRGLELLSFVVLGLAGLAINSLVMFLAVGKLGLAVLPAKSLAAGGTFVTNFILRRQLLFSPGSHIPVSNTPARAAASPPPSAHGTHA